MLTKPNGNYSSDDLAMLSSILKEALEASTDGAGLNRAAHPRTSLSAWQGHNGQLHSGGDRPGGAQERGYGEHQAFRSVKSG